MLFMLGYRGVDDDEADDGVLDFRKLLLKIFV